MRTYPPLPQTSGAITLPAEWGVGGCYSPQIQPVEVRLQPAEVRLPVEVRLKAKATIASSVYRAASSVYRLVCCDSPLWGF